MHLRVIIGNNNSLEKNKNHEPKTQLNLSKISYVFRFSKISIRVLCLFTFLKREYLR